MRNTSESDLLQSELTREVIGAFFAVYNELGPGFLESVYVNALVIALAEKGLNAQVEVPLLVRFRNHVVGHFRADLLVEESLVLEVKAVSALAKAHEAQLVNYLRATSIPIGMVLNFGPRAEFKRRVCTTRLNRPLSDPSA
jgi:GxxExxY protein